MKKKTTLISLALASLMVFSACDKQGENPDNTNSTEQTPAGTVFVPEFDDSLTVTEVVKDMGLGINLGNTMEAIGGENAWGSPSITKEMIQGYADCGFGVLRIPVAWSQKMADDYTIDPERMSRVKQITQWTVESGMYAIVNIHWDGGWWENFPTDKEKCMKKYTRVWEQICEEFKDFNGKVMFESLNEEGGNWEKLWNRYTNVGDKEASYSLLNEINQKFVDIVRGSSHDNNKNRHLLIAGYCTDIGQTCDELYKMPNDPKNRCAVSVHYYTPATFALIDKDESWGKIRPTWGTEEDMKELVDNMEKMKKSFVDKGVPVIIGEYSVCAKKLRERDSVHLYITSVIKEATKWGMCPVLWDVAHGEENIENGYYDRNTCKFLDPELLQKMKEANVNK